MDRRKQTCFAEKRFFAWYEDTVSVSLRNKSGSYGGGSEVLVTEHTNTEKADAVCFESERNNADKANALCFGNGQTDGLNSSGDVSRSLNCMHDPMGVCENVT